MHQKCQNQIRINIVKTNIENTKWKVGKKTDQPNSKRNKKLDSTKTIKASNTKINYYKQ